MESTGTHATQRTATQSSKTTDRAGGRTVPHDHPDGVFHGRREAFRTQEQFYLSGFHNWQLNRESSDRAADWEDRDGYALRAETKILGFSGFVSVTSHLQLALAA